MSESSPLIGPPDEPETIEEISSNLIVDETSSNLTTDKSEFTPKSNENIDSKTEINTPLEIELNTDQSTLDNKFDQTATDTVIKTPLDIILDEKSENIEEDGINSLIISTTTTTATSTTTTTDSSPVSLQPTVVSIPPKSEGKQEIEPEKVESPDKPENPDKPIKSERHGKKKKEKDIELERTELEKGVTLFFGRNATKQDMAEAIKIWTPLADVHHHPEAMAWLYCCYFHGFGTTKDKIKSHKLLRSSAKRGNPYCLAESYFYGINMEKNITVAIEHYKKAADTNFPPALFDLGNCYEKGVGVTIDLTVAVDYFRRSADLGYAPAQNSLGACYTKGTGIEKDMNLALNFFKAAADQGHPIALYNLGIFYEKGQFVAKDQQKAVEYFKLSADRNHSPGMHFFYF